MLVIVNDCYELYDILDVRICRHRRFGVTFANNQEINMYSV